MSQRTPSIALILVIAALGVSPLVQAAGPGTFSGDLLGEVRATPGVAQMGATVLLFNRYDHLVRQAITNEQGRFVFDTLPPDLYSVRVSLASFVPAIRRNIAILAGSESLLKINLASVLSTIELAPLSAPAGTLMTDEWKWVLRASQATRPLLRLLPDQPVPAAARSLPAVFADTTGVLSLSAGGPDPFAGALQQDLGTAFALATSINGRTRVRVSGNLGFAPSTGLPSAGFKTTYSRASDGASNGPQVSLMARQIYLPSMTGSATPGSVIGPALRTATMTATEKVEIADNIHLEYGVALESISYQDRLNYMSAFARAGYEFGPNGTLKIAYSSAADPAELMPVDETAAELKQDLSSLARLPRISRRNGRTNVQRNQSYEAGYTYVQGSRTYSASLYREEVNNAAFLLSGSFDLISTDDMLTDLNSRGVVFNAGRYQRSGYSIAATQNVGEHAQFTLAAGRAGALQALALDVEDPSGDNLRSSIRQSPRLWTTVRLSGTLPWTGTYLGGSYGWTDFRVLTPMHYSLTNKGTQDIGWNTSIRQPLPKIAGMRMEALAEIRNILAQGYLPIHAGDRRAILTNSPRGVRGGLNFIF